jgi:predicted lipid-binding transport protein (Tim44 family)
VIEGDLVKPQETTEIWTFVRPTGSKPVDWKLSAIQQVA